MRCVPSLAGRVVTPDDADYDELRVVVAGTFDERPALIVRPASAQDVALAVTTARDAGVEIAVRCGGHSGAGHSTVDGGLVIDVRDLDAIDIDVEGRTAWAGAGMSAAAYTAAVGEHGLATGFGDTGSVGIAGLTLGGGIGYLVRRFGLTIDSLLAVELVTADGAIRTVDAASDPDLFWALRGGGGNLGSPPASGSGCTRCSRSSAGCSCSRPRPRPWPASWPRRPRPPTSSRPSPTS